MPGVPYGAMLIDFCRGQVAMARGEVAEATACYTRALATARASFLRDQGSAVRGEAFLSEMNLERNRTAAIQSTFRIPKALLARISHQGS